MITRRGKIELEAVPINFFYNPFMVDIIFFVIVFPDEQPNEVFNRSAIKINPVVILSRL